MKLKEKLKIWRFKYFCRKWKTCVNLSFNQEWVLCRNPKCPLMSYQGMTRAYKKTTGNYKEEDDVSLKGKGL